MMETSYLPPGSLWGNRFEIERVAGSGGMGTVYRARDRQSGKLVALKLLNCGTNSADDDERFAREALLLSELRHPAIVAYVAHGQTPDGRRFLAMEWLDGHDLGQHLRNGPLPLRDALLIIHRAAEALQVAHGRGIVHRDLKPTNLFLPSGDISRCILLDFGIARRLSVSNAITRTGMVVGTPEYMAPEQARGARELTPATDLFALGCVLYECLTGEPPFTGEHVAAVLVRILFEEPPPITSRRTGLPQTIVTLIADLLNKDPEQRVPNASVLLARLELFGSVPELPIFPTQAAPANPRSTFAEHEQVLFSLVVAAASSQARPLASTLPATADRTEVDCRDALQSAVARMGARAEYLVDGTLAVTVPQTGSAQDQAAMAARLALYIKEHWQQASVVVTTGRGSSRGTTAVGEVADRAMQILELRRGAHPAAPPGSDSGVWTDELSGRLLGARFAVTEVQNGWMLLGEEKEVDESRPLLGKPTPCVGRQTELAMLEAQLNGCIEESQARVVLITAEPGVGKSRLRHEFLRCLEKMGVPITVLLGRGDMMSAGAPYEMLSRSIRRLCGLSGGEPLELQCQRLHARIAQHVPAIAQKRVVLFVGELCKIPFPEAENPMLQAARSDPKIMHDRMRRALLDWLAAECAVAPLLLCLDDFQWGDELTVSVLNEALSELAGAPLFVLSFARPEVHKTFPGLWRRYKVQELPLQGLSKKACERLIVQVLGNSVPVDAVSRAVLQASGNALFLEEIIRAIAEGKSEDHPETVLAMLQARIGRLDSGARRAVRAAAVFGQTFWLGGVATVLGLPKNDSALEAWLTAAVDAELVQSHASSRFAQEMEYGFRHALVRDAAYSLLLAADRTSGHHAAGEFLDAAGETDAAIIAEHFELSGDKQRAAGFYLRAAENSLDRDNNLSALRHVERGLLSDPSSEIVGQLRAVESLALAWLNRHERMGDPAELALARLRPGSLPWCRALGPAFVAAATSQNAGRSFEILALALAAEADADARVVFAMALLYIHSTLVGAVPLATMQAVQTKAAAIIAQAEITNRTLRRYLHTIQGLTALYYEPRPWTVVTEYRQALELCEQAGDEKLYLAVCPGYSERGWLELGDTVGVHQRLLDLSSRIEKTEDSLSIHRWRCMLASALCELPDEAGWDQAAGLVTPILAATGGHVLIASWAQYVMVRVALRRGRLQDAVARAGAALKRCSVWLNNVALFGAAQLRAFVGLGAHAEAIALAESILSAISRHGSIGFAEVDFRIAATETFYFTGNRERARVELRETLRQIQLRLDDIADPFWKTSYLTRNPYCARALTLAKEWSLDVLVV